jgi:hypothetical protein
MSHISTTPIAPSSQAHEAVEQSLQHQSESLDEGLSESFPASDPVAVSITCIIPASLSRRKHKAPERH